MIDRAFQDSKETGERGVQNSQVISLELVFSGFRILEIHRFPSGL